MHLEYSKVTELEIH